jgi:hypothetical protein
VNIRRESVADLLAVIGMALIMAACAPVSSSGPNSATPTPNCLTATISAGTLPSALSHGLRGVGIKRDAADCAATATADAQAMIKANNAKTIATITAWETDPQKMLATQEATTSQFSNDLSGTPTGRMEAPMGVALVYDLKKQATIDGNGNTLNSAFNKTGYVGRVTRKASCFWYHHRKIRHHK